MTTYNTGYPYSQGIASPPVMVPPVELGGRVRVAYFKHTPPAVATAGDTDVVNLGTLPLGALILASFSKFGDLNDGSHTAQPRIGTTAIGAADDVGTAQTAYVIDYTGTGQKVDSAAKQTVNIVLSGAAFNQATGAEIYELIVLYAID